MPQYSIEEIIRQAMQEGKFDNLPGKGKPLHLEDNPHQDPEWRVAHHMLKSGGYSLPWIDLLSEINDNLQNARQILARDWKWRTNDNNALNNNPDWQDALNLFEQRIQEINQQIRTYNLAVPNTRFQITLINTQKEIDRIIMNDGDSFGG